LISPFIGYAQNLIKPPHPTFTPFEGTVYKMPRIPRQIGNVFYNKIQEHYGNNIYEYEEIGKIGLKKLNIPETAINKRNFPGVQQKIKFAMILNAEMEIKLAACYEFSLSSDDGSILWVDSTLVVNNDGGHQMKMKKDSIVLTEGIYPVKVWYFQGMPDRYGLVLDAKIIGKPAVCPVKSPLIKDSVFDVKYFDALPTNAPQKVKLEKSQKIVPIEKFTLDNSILFEVGQYELKEGAMAEIEQIAKIIKNKAPTSISINGHTDNTGSLTINQQLSLNRAISVMEQLQVFIKNPAIKMSAYGKAAAFPIASNDTTKGRAKNRRVELVLNP